MAELGPKIPQGLVLFILGNTSNTNVGTYRRRRPNPQNNDRHGVLVTLPSSYQDAVEVALRYFGTQLSVTSTDDIVLKRAVSTTHTFGGVIYAQFDAADWEKIMVGPELEIGVFKSTKAEPTVPQDPFDEPYTPPMTPVPVPAPFNAPMNNPWLNNNFSFTPITYNTAPTTNKNKTIQLTRVTSKGETLANGEGIETALISLPETYEDCERVAREIFNPPEGSKMTMKVASMPSGMYNYADYGKPASWMSVHKSAYATSILTYSGAFEIRVDFEGGKVDEATHKDNANAGSSDPFLMI